jgi:hypothetical protein
MAVVESVLAGMERLLLPKLERIEAEQKALRELMEEKFRAVDFRFQALEDKFNVRFQSLEDKLNLDKRLTALEDRQKPQQESAQ